MASESPWPTSPPGLVDHEAARGAEISHALTVNQAGGAFRGFGFGIPGAAVHKKLHIHIQSVSRYTSTFIVY